MNLICNLCSSLFPSLEGEGSQREREREIDAATRFATLGLIKASVVWMLISALLGVISAIKLHSPDYLGDSECLTYGKVVPAFWNALVYGWLINAGLACVAWIVARLAGRAVANNYLLTVSTGAWNVAVLLGVIGIFWGDQTAFRMLEFPTWISPLLFVAFIGIGLWVVLTFKARAFRSAFASQWYALAAVFSFVWIFTAAQVMIFCLPAQGVFQNLVAAWFVNNLFGLAVAPLAFATIYYLIPKALGQHIIGYRQSGIAFWSWILFTSFSGLAAVVNGPFEAWVGSLGVFASFGLFLPVTILSIQFLSSLIFSFSRIWDTVSVRFVFYGVVAFTVSSLLIVFGSLHTVQESVQFSQFDQGVRFLFLAGFAGMTFTGGIYFILPRLLNKELPSSGLADFQFWMQGLGIFAVSVGLIVGGVQQGSLLNGSAAEAVEIVANSKAYFFVTTLGFFIFLCSSVAFLASFTWMLLAGRAEKEKSADLIESAPELEYHAS